MAGLGQHARGFFLVGDSEGAHFHQRLARQIGGGDGARGFHQCLRLGQAGKDDRRRFGNIDSVVGDFDAGAGGFAAARSADVVANHAPAGGRQILGESAAHDAEADDADCALGFLRPSHSGFPMVKMLIAAYRFDAVS